MVNSHPLREKALQLSIAAVHASHVLNEEREYVLSKQFLKSATSIGANLQEAKYAQSKLDFLSKMNIALKEAAETEYWIAIIQASNCGKSISWELLSQECHQIAAMLVQATKTLKQKLNVTDKY